MANKNWDDMTEEEREEYANQDYVVQTEVLVNFNIENISFQSWPDLLRVDSPLRRKGLIIALWKDGKVGEDIAVHAGCSGYAHTVHQLGQEESTVYGSL